MDPEEQTEDSQEPKDWTALIAERIVQLIKNDPELHDAVVGLIDANAKKARAQAARHLALAKKHNAESARKS